MRAILLLSALTLCLPAADITPLPGKTAEIAADFAKDHQELWEAYLKDLEKAKASYRKELDRELTAITKKGDLAGANAINEVISGIDGLDPVPAAAASDPLAGLYGTWNCVSGSYSYIWELRPEGAFKDSREGKEGSWSLDEQGLTIKFAHGTVLKFPLPLKTRDWEGTHSNGTPHFLTKQ